LALPLSVEEQDARLRAECPQFSLIAHARWVAVWEGTLRPVCQTYRIKIVYFSRRYFPGFDLANPYVNVFVVDPPIGADPRGTGEPPQHVYRLGHHPDFPRLCIYDPTNDQWEPSEYLVDRIIPWTIKWLFFHEEWVASGVWKGGGRHPEEPQCLIQDDLGTVSRARPEQFRTAEFHKLGRKIGLSASSLSMAAASAGFFPLQPSRLLSVATPMEIQSQIISTLPLGPRLVALSPSGLAPAWTPLPSATSTSSVDPKSSHRGNMAA
jgi:hypothetical protein